LFKNTKNDERTKQVANVRASLTKNPQNCSYFGRLKTKNQMKIPFQNSNLTFCHILIVNFYFLEYFLFLSPQLFTKKNDDEFLPKVFMLIIV